MITLLKTIFGFGEKTSSSSVAPATVPTVPKAPTDVPAPTVPTAPIVQAPLKVEYAIPFLTLDDLKKILQGNPNYKEWFALLQKFLPIYEVNTINRVSAFLANTVHETGNFTILEENLNYNRERLLQVFPKYFNEENVDKYVGKKILIASRIYANRMGNGDEASQDGWKFRGRGLIQITGKQNYTTLSLSLKKSLDETIKYLSIKEGVLVGSLSWWSKNGINKIADTGNIGNVRKRVNGGSIGLQDTTTRYNYILGLLKA